jgi:hypothetical protein
VVVTTPHAALRYQRSTQDRDRVIADALAELVAPAPVVEIHQPRDGRAMGGSERDAGVEEHLV